jgi:hypothetical protein
MGKAAAVAEGEFDYIAGQLAIRWARDVERAVG